MDSKTKSFDDLDREIKDLWHRADEIEPADPEKAQELNLKAHELVLKEKELLNL
ncbi:hypothetical protein [Methanobacterium aggregans]|uniref:hypothetical protein n=1 Tax=Methanobacterium aggregans TaxID=1615586 RepID=UPI00320D88D6